MKLKRNLFSAPLCFVINVVLVYIVYAVCRLVFLAVNWGMFSDTITWGCGMVLGSSIPLPSSIPMRFMPC